MSRLFVILENYQEDSVYFTTSAMEIPHIGCVLRTMMMRSSCSHPNTTETMVFVPNVQIVDNKLAPLPWAVQNIIDQESNKTFNEGDIVRLISHDSKYNVHIVKSIAIGTEGVVDEQIEGNPPDAIQVRIGSGIGAIDVSCLEKVK